MRLLRSALAALTLGFLAFGAAAALPPGVTAGPSMGGISEYRLENGLQVLLIPDPARDTITVNVTYLVGSRHEGYGEAGMAHLLEHMLFKGTPRYANPKTEFTSRGARYNGTTSYDRTNYFETFPASDENLRLMLDLEADRMVNARVAEERPRFRDDGGAQRVRVGREQPVQPAARAHERLGVHVAQLRPVGDRHAVRHRERADRAPAGVLSPVLPARQRRPGGRRPHRRGEDAADGGRHLREDPASGAQADPDLHRGAAAGRRPDGDAAPRRRRADRRGDVPHAARHARRVPGGGPAHADPFRTAVRPPAQGAGRDRQGGVRVRHRAPAARRRLGVLRRHREARPVARRRAQRAARHRRGLCAPAGHRRGDRRARAPSSRTRSSRCSTTPAASRSRCPSSPPWATGGCSSGTATSSRAPPRTTCSASQ